MGAEEEDDSSKKQDDAQKIRKDVPLIVSACQDETITDTVKGTYFPHGTNHGKVVYKREAGLDVLIYYWDERDGEELCGWWFGPSAGGEMVWAYHPSRKAATPPAAEWNVPHDGAIDPTFTVTPASKGDAKRPKPAAPSTDQAAPPSKKQT